jgi:hypothetical protein
VPSGAVCETGESTSFRLRMRRTRCRVSTAYGEAALFSIAGLLLALSCALFLDCTIHQTDTNVVQPWSRVDMGGSVPDQDRGSTAGADHPLYLSRVLARFPYWERRLLMAFDARHALARTRDNASVNAFAITSTSHSHRSLQLIAFGSLTQTS